MALTESTMLPLGTLAPEFSLLDTVSGSHLSFDDVKGERGTLLFFICNHCPYVIHVNDELVRLAADYTERGIGVAAISSNDVGKYPIDSPDNMTAFAARSGYTFPYLYDETQDVARGYDAACTPDFYVFDAAGKLAYRGRLDDSRPNNGTPLTGEDLRAALDAVLAGEEPVERQYPSMGCGIKWK